MTKEAVFYVVQKAFIKKNESILILNDPKEGLDFPGGKIQEGEIDQVQALKREVREETGLEINVGYPFMTIMEPFPEDHAFKGKKFFLVAYKCEYISGEVKLSDEHDNFSWVTSENYKKVDDGTSYFDILSKYFN